MQNRGVCAVRAEGQGQVAPSRPVLDPTFPARYFGARRRCRQCSVTVRAGREWVSDSISYVGVGGLILPPPLTYRVY